MTHQHLARKRFGQHFLTDPQILTRIVRALNPKAGENLVEIGPGLGALTAEVLPYLAHLKVIEIDRDLSRHLQNIYANKITIFEQDVLKFDFASLANDQKLRIFGNLPYNISTPLLFHLLSFSNQIQDLLFMLQKEVVMRLAAAPNTPDYGRLSVMIQYGYQVQWLFDVPPSAFSPPPKVMSSIVRLRPYQQEFPHPLAQDYAHFAQLVNVAFQHRRKTLKRALATMATEKSFIQAEIDPQQRPQTLSVTNFVNLSNCLIAQNS